MPAATTMAAASTMMTGKRPYRAKTARADLVGRIPRDSVILASTLSAQQLLTKSLQPESDAAELFSSPRPWVWKTKEKKL